MATRSGWLFAMALVLAAVPARAGTGGLPDLRPLIDDEFFPTIVERHATPGPEDVAEGCAGGVTDRTLVHFTLSTFNEGTADLVLGDPGCPDCLQFPGPTCTNELFECSPLAGHGHAHFSKYALYELLPSPDTTAVATGHKQGFCLEDTICENPVYDCGYQGLSLGCKDVYPPIVLGCQYVDATGLPGGRYLLRATVNYERILAESNYDNNVAERLVEVCEAIDGPRVRLRAREDDPGTVYWTIKGRVYAQVPFSLPDPFKDGAMARIELDGATVSDVVIPGRPGSGHCGPKDGWKQDPETGIPTYYNESGFVDRDCTIPTGGLRRLRVSVRPGRKRGVAVARVKYVAIGRTALEVPVEQVRVTVGPGAETGPCYTAAASCESRHCTPTSAGGAFVD